MDAWIWAALGAALFLFEILMPGYFLAFPALGCFSAAAAAGLFGVSGIEAQLAVSVAASALIFAALARLYRRLMRGGTPSLVNNPRRLVGACGWVEEPLAAGRGKIRLGDTVWLAAGPDLAAGSPVRVVGVEGTVLQVEPQASDPAPPGRR